jgi:outer membrane protein assembly factor BamB
MTPPRPLGSRRSWLARVTTSMAAGALAVLSILITVVVPASAASADWPTYLFDNGHSSFNNAATTITPQNAATLHKSWTFTPTKKKGQPAARILGSPVAVGGTVYIASFNGTLWALNESTGTVRWSADVGFTPVGACPTKAGPTATPVVAPDPSRSNQLTVYMAGGDGSLYAIDAADGSVVWQTMVAQTNVTPAEFLFAAPVLVNGDLFIGVASNCEPPLAPGRVVELSQDSGTILNTYHAVAADSGGAGIWITPASDGTSIWVTTGNADETGTEPPGDSYSVVRLSASDLSKQDIWTVTPSLDGTDFDFGASPTLFAATLGGTPTQMVGACNKNGYFYALRAQNLAAGPVWSRKIGAKKAGGPTCLASAIWDQGNNRLIVGSNKTTIAGVSYGGSLRSVNPATGKPLWQLGLNPGPIEGSPSEDGAGVVAAATADQTGGTNQLYLVDPSNGQVLTQIALPSAELAQPVFADGYLFSAPITGGLTAYTV